MMIKQISTNCNAYSLYNNKLKEEEENHDETINKKTKTKNHLKSQDDCILFCLSVIFFSYLQEDTQFTRQNYVITRL
jgi:hypothetical protein